MQRINFTETTLTTLTRNARCSFANAVYKLTMKAQQGLKCDDLFKKSVLMNEVNKLLCKYKLDTCISFHPALEGGASSWYFGIGSFTGLITYNLIIDGVETFIGSGSSVENIVIDINNNTEGTGVTAVLGEGGYFTIYSPVGCFIKADLTGSKDPEGSIPATITTFTKGKCPQEETCVDYTEEELNCITPQDLQLIFEFTHRYKETLAKSTRRVTSPFTSSSSSSASDCCNWGSIGGSIGNQSDLVAYLNTIKKNFISASNESILLSNDIKSLNFLGAGVTATNSGGDISITIPGGGGGGFECADLEGCNISLLTNDAGYLTDISATNGLTEDPANNFKLGGTLVEDTTIYNDTFDFTVSRSDSGDSILGLNTSSGRGVVGSSVNSHGVVGLSTNGKGVSGVSTNGVGVDASSGTSRAGQFGISPASNNSVGENIILYRNVASNAAGANGIGQSLIFASAASDANMYYTNALVSKWTDATLATRTSEFSIIGSDNGVLGDKLVISGSGQLKLNEYGTVTPFTGTPAYLLGVDASGNVIETTVSGGSQTLADTLALGNTSGAYDIQFDATQGLLFANTSRLREGTIDAGLGGQKGVAQICAVGYELKWEAGRLYVMDGNGLFIRQSLYNFNIAPTVTDDVTKGYMTGSLWTLDDSTTYVCTDAANGIWVEVGLTAGVLEITVGSLQTLESNGELSLTTIYIITDSTPYKLMCKAEAVNQLSKTATIVDNVYSGQVYYDLQIDTISNGTIYDVNRNNYNGVLPSDLTIGFSCSYNTFYQKADSNTIGANCERNTFEQGAAGNTLGSSNSNNTFKQRTSGFIFGDHLANVTIEANVSGTDYTATPDYDFLYNNAYASTIFTDSIYNYHRWYDPANDRIVVTNLSTLDETYIGGSGGVYVKDANDNVFFSDAEQSTTTFVGVSACTNNIFHQGAINNSLGELSRGNTFGQDSYGFTFGNKLRNVTIEANIIGADYSDQITYAFLYNKDYSSTIFQSGGINYHRYFDIANDRIEITDLATPINITYIGGGAGSGDVVGPASAVDNNIATFDGTTGKLIQDGGTTIADINTNAVDRITVKLAESITKGQAVYISSANGTNIIVSKASNLTEATSSKTLGLLETTGSTNAIVNVVTSGLLDGLNTSAATIGDAVWLGTAGNLIFGLASKPYAPAHLVYIGVVSRVSATVGEIIVKVQNGFELKEIHDVFAQSPAAKDGLFYDSTTSLWKARPVAASDIDANVSNTEFGYLDGVTSSIQTQINAIKKPISSVGNGTAVTGVIVNTYSKGLLIAANSRVANDVVQIDFQVAKTGAAGNIQLRFYWNTTNDLSGSPILLGTSPNGAALWLAFSRLLSIEVANSTGNATKVAPTSVTTLATGYGTSTTATSTVAIDWTTNGYLICSILNSSAADSSVCNMLKLL